ncbi:hypothetical protein EYF80_039816 [Liparis tanakae]|uniref:Uncharacterized protein n=1 Tax=Liparis tanakae TaxID=230148 RepID=A0A4Z2G928_9TELE|nr:hypothetical protein EYF80_039816 [Liparis tanakae]
MMLRHRAVRRKYRNIAGYWMNFNFRPIHKLLIWPKSTALPWENSRVYRALGEQRTNMQAMRFPLVVRVMKHSMASFSRVEYCQSARSERCSVQRLPLSSDMRLRSCSMDGCQRDAVTRSGYSDASRTIRPLQRPSRPDSR